MTQTGYHIAQPDFETLYIRLRRQEGRMYSDEEVINLPNIQTTHPHYKEWQLRKHSSQKLISYLKRKNKPLDILEPGCGNGWLSHRLSFIPGSRVIGTDINFTEIQQAARVFQHIPNLHFMYVYLEPGVFKEKRFDSIIFAASIQYFASINETIKNTIPLLKPGGEIHIIDSPFYQLLEVPGAQQRSRHYYESAGFSQMTDFYFHHSLDELQGYNYSVLSDPKSLPNKLPGNKNPFHWICIQSNHP
ncbi:class I SAM-dependent methyltransferase [Terrimonas alba]|uniref:class I SAM-dependent methyltransferase n=1 Tax=Terrimonas alba TaxID=3349636 RepID=UPI0035F3E0CE